MNEHKPEPWEEEFVKEFSTKGGYVGTGITKTELITDFIRTLLADQNTAKYHEGYMQGRFDQEMEGNTTNAERIRGHCDKILHDGQSEIDFVHDSPEVILMKTVINTSINRMRSSLAAARLIEKP